MRQTTFTIIIHFKTMNNMKTKTLLLALIVVCAAAVSRSDNTSEAAPSNPTLATKLSKLIEAGDEHEEKAIISDIIATGGPTLVPDLVAHLRDVHKPGDLNRVRTILRNLMLSPADTLVSELQGETDPAQKAKLVNCLRDFTSPAVMAVLRAQLDDTRRGNEPSAFERAPVVGRVCDEAYHVILHKLDGKVSPDKAIRRSMSVQERARLIEALKARLAAMDAGN
jgi:hypothetical protein